MPPRPCGCELTPRARKSRSSPLKHIFPTIRAPTRHSTQHWLYPLGLPGSGCRKNINSRSELLFRMPSPLNANSPQPPSPDNSGNSRTKIHRLIKASRVKSAGYGVFLITSKVLDARHRGATAEAYGAIRREEERSKATPQMMP